MQAPHNLSLQTIPDRYIYLAGPDVFSVNSKAIFGRLEHLCRARGMIGVSPCDEAVSKLIVDGVAKSDIAKRIYSSNVDHIKSCDGVIANMVPFRGDLEPDSGTVFEVGLAIALGKPVALYLPQGLEDSGSRIRRICGAGKNGFDDQFGALIEDFGLPLNLMLSCSASFFLSPEDALDHLQTTLIKNLTNTL